MISIIQEEIIKYIIDILIIVHNHGENCILLYIHTVISSTITLYCFTDLHVCSNKVSQFLHLYVILEQASIRMSSSKFAP